LSRNADQAFQLLKLALTQARLEADDVARVRSQLVAELKRDANDPEAMAAKAFREAAFPNHAYGRPVRGDLATIRSAHARRYYCDARTFVLNKDLKIGVVGAIDAETLALKIDDIFASFAKTNDLITILPIQVANIGQCKTISILMCRSQLFVSVDLA